MATSTDTPSARPKTKIAKTRIGAANVDRILDAALHAFARHGLRGTRVEQIAADVGMSKTNLLYYFQTKQSLYEAVLARTLHVWLTPLRALDVSQDPAEALSLYIHQKFELSRRSPEASRLFAMEVMQGAPNVRHVLATELSSLVEAKAATIRTWIGDGRMAYIDPYHLIFSIWAITQHYADFSSQIKILTGRDLSDNRFYAEARNQATAIILNGILKTSS